jgi:hypothetical protein
MKKLIIIIIFIFSLIYIIGCSSSKKVVNPEISRDTTKPYQPVLIKSIEEKYNLTERYIVSGSRLSFEKTDSNNILDPITGEFIWLKEGNKFTVVLHEFEKDSNTNERTREDVLAFEISDLKVGTRFYPEKFSYYLLSYGEEKNRIDGKTINGYIIFRSITEKYATGYFDFMIEGVKKAFDKEDVKVEVVFKGSFKLPLIDITQINK